MTVDSLAAAFQHFNITHVTALEFFRCVTQAEDRCEAVVSVGGAVISLCLSQPLQPMISLIFGPDGRELSLSEIADLTPPPSPSRMDSALDSARAEEHHLVLEKFRSNPVLPFWMDAATQLEIRQLCKEQMRDRGMQHDRPGEANRS